MKLWHSVVGKVWGTILILVSFVLFFLTILLLEFFEGYHVNQVQDELSEKAEKIASIIDEHDNKQIGMEVAWELIDEPTHVIIAEDEKTFHYSPKDENDPKLTKEEILENDTLSKVFTEEKFVKEEMPVQGQLEQTNRYENSIVMAAPIHMGEGESGAVIIYQSLEEIRETTQQTTKLILLAAGIAIVLTTIFAFFLSTRITAPLLKMKEAANEVAKGKFDLKVPILSTDEIGELAKSFNQMAKQLKYNINALSQEKEQLSSILSSMADGVITIGSDGAILITNPPAERFLQNWQYEKGGKDSGESAPKLVENLFKAVAETEKEQIGEISVQGRSYVIIVSPLYNAKHIRGAVAVVRDMTEERRLDKLRIDFIANVSHELRTPIAMLQGYSEAIVDDIAASEEEKKEIAKIIYDESLRMGRLVNELLDLARMEAGHIVLNVEKVDVTAFMQRVTNKFQALAKEKEIDLLLEVEENAGIAELDPDRVEQVMTNLIDNALRHTSEGGMVKVTHKKTNSGNEIYVQDTGEGISEEDLPFVFERFYKADKARTRRKSGTGLGLAIAKNIVEAHKGYIKVQSKFGEGTTFSIFLPNKEAK